MERDRLESLLSEMSSLGVAVIGDFCLDAYWVVDPSRSTVSVETRRPTMPVREQTYSLGGAGNIVQNLLALGVKRVHGVGVIGDDMFGRELTRLLDVKQVTRSTLVVQKESWDTPVYGKPYFHGEEQSRLDFGMWNELSKTSEEKLVQCLDRTVRDVRAVIVNQQLDPSIYSHGVVREINRLVQTHRDKIFLVDSRNKSRLFKNVIHRFNETEAASHCVGRVEITEKIHSEDARQYAMTVEKTTGKPVFVSRGEEGGLVCWRGRVHEVEGIRTHNAIDSVGAGDTAAAALAAALSAGADPFEAGELANLASAVTVQKIRTTGTASPEEILRLFEQRVDEPFQ